jgi:hypothetical protein
LKTFLPPPPSILLLSKKRRVSKDPKGFSPLSSPCESLILR